MNEYKEDKQKHSCKRRRKVCEMYFLSQIDRSAEPRSLFSLLASNESAPWTCTIVSRDPGLSDDGTGSIFPSLKDIPKALSSLGLYMIINSK